MFRHLHSLTLDSEKFPAPVVTLDGEKIIVQMNDAAVQYAQKYIAALRPHVYFPYLVEGGEQLRFDNVSRVVTAYGDRGSELNWLLLAFPSVYDGEKAGYDLLIVDQTEAERSRRDVFYMAYHDDLTGLCNRRKIYQELSRWIEQYHDNGALFAVMMLDIDNFKRINDTLGHQYGDLLLVECSRRVNACLAASGRRFLFGRLGGDEFVILLECRDRKDDVRAMMRLMEHELHRPYHLNKEMFHTTSSIGIAVFPHDGATAEELLRTSDLAMYERKKMKQGRTSIRNFS